MIDWQAIALTALASAPIAALITAWFLRRTERERIRIESKRVVHADWQAFSDKLAARVSSLEDRVVMYETKAERDAITKRRMGDHIDVLEAHIWQGKPPPPPPRPAEL